MMKMLYQHDLRDCGAACLSMISSHYGANISIAKCRELTKTDTNGTNFYGITNAAKQIGFISEAFSGHFDELMDSLEKKEISFPFIAHTITENNLFHFVVVVKITKNKIHICDPGKGKIKVSKDYFRTIWTGNIVALEPSSAFPLVESREASNVKQFFDYIKDEKLKIVLIVLMSLVISFIGIFGAFVFQIVIDGISVNGTYSIFKTGINLTVIFSALILLYLFQALIHFLRCLLITYVYTKIDRNLFLKYYNHLLDIPISSIKVRKTGEYLSRFSDIDAIREAISDIVVTLFLDSIMSVLVGVILININFILFMISLPAILAYIVIVILYRKQIEFNNRKVMENDSIIKSWLKESLDGIETIKGNNSSDYFKKNTIVKYGLYIKAVIRNSIVSSSQDVIISTIEIVSKMIVLWIGFSFALSNSLSIGSVITFYALLSYFSEPVKNLVELQPLIQKANVALDRLNDVFTQEKEKFSEGKCLDGFNTLVINNLCFRYGNRKLLLKNINMSLKKGDTAMLVGESGSGKSTLAKLLLRYYEYESGTIFINDKPLNEFSVESIRGTIAYVPQDVFLFADTIKNNLIMGNSTISETDIIEACKISKADEFIDELPLKYDFPLSENGLNISGGQRQRIALARALLQKPKILILDEATSNLDPLTEKHIINNIISAQNETTVIIITHRMNMIGESNIIFVMDKGEIIEAGTHKELINNNKKYTELWKAQREFQ